MSRWREPQVVGLAGAPGVGKTTIARILCELDEDRYIHSPFADKLVEYVARENPFYKEVKATYAQLVAARGGHDAVVKEYACARVGVEAGVGRWWRVAGKKSK